MITWWNGLELMQQIFAIVAIPATLILIIQTILLLLGAGSDHDATMHAGGMHDAGVHDINVHDVGLHDGTAASGGMAHDMPADAGHDPSMHETTAAYHDSGLRLFTLQGIVAFFAIGGWVGIAVMDFGLSAPIAGILALAAGVMSLLLVAWLLGMMLKLQSSGNLDIRNAVGLTGEVYLRIPGNLKGYGKVTLILQARSLEIDAMTDHSEEIGTGQQVEVVAIRGDRLLVRPLN